MPKISVIIPIYNTEKYLRKCLDSVCGQTLKDIEIICINDCSPDDSLQILQEYASNDNRIKIIDFKENKGAAVARNVGIDAAKGEYIGFVDSDDFIDLDFYERLYERGKSENAELVTGKTQMENESGVRQKNPLIDNFFSQLNKNKLHFNHLFWGGVYKREMLNRHSIRFSEGLVYGEDRLLPLQASYYANKLVLVDGTTYHYVRNDDSITINKKNEKIMKSFVAYNKMVLEFLNSVALTLQDYNTVAMRFLRDCIGFTFELDESLQRQFYVKFKNEVFSLVRGDEALYADIKEILSTDDFKAYIVFAKKYTNKVMLNEIRNNLALKGINA